MRANLKPEIPNDETAEELCYDILIWLAEKLDLMERFLKFSGVHGDAVRQMLGERKFYAELIAFILNHDPTLQQFCAAKNVTPEWMVICYEVFSHPREIH